MTRNDVLICFEIATRTRAVVRSLYAHTHPSATDRPRVRSMQSIVSALIACHLGGCPLDLAHLATARDSDLIHDVYGICDRIVDESSELALCFRPRYSMASRTTTQGAEV